MNNLFKTILPLLGYCLFSATAVHSQSNLNRDVVSCCCDPLPDSICHLPTVKTNRIFLDFKSKQLVLPKNGQPNFFKKGSAFQITVMNYNPLLYKVLINNSDSSAAVPMDGKLLSAFLDPSGIPALVGGLLANTGLVPSQVQETQMEFIGNTVVAFTTRDSIISVRHLKATFDRKNPEISVDSIHRQEISIIRNYGDSLATLRDSINEVLFRFARHLSIQRLVHPDCNSFANLSPLFTDSLRRTLIPLIHLISHYRKVILNASGHYLVITAPFRTQISKLRRQEFTDSLLNRSYSLLLAEVAKMDSSLTYNTIESLMQRFEIVAQASPCFTSLPIFMQKDISNIHIELKPRFDSTGLQAYETDFFLPWIQRRVWGVSGGVYISPLHNETYAVRTQVNATDTSYRIVDDNSGRSEFGINALAYTAWHLSDKGPSYLGLSFGAGLSIESKPKPRIFFGVSYVNGEKNRLVFTLGAVSGFVNTLSSAYDTQTNYATAPSNFIRDRIKTSGFFSISYSFLQ